MEKYISRKYLTEKWNILKWAMEKNLDIYGENTDDNRITPEEAERVQYEITAMTEAIIHELYGK